MTPVTTIKALLAVLGIALWAFGIRTDSRPFQIAGFACVVLAFMMRLLRKR